MTKYTQERYNQDCSLVKEIEDWSIDFNPWKNKEGKIKILKEILGYKRLTGNCGSFLLLEECDGMKINTVLREKYSDAQKRIEKFGDPLLEENQEKNLIVKNNFVGRKNYDRETHNGLEIKIQKSTGQGMFVFS